MLNSKFKKLLSTFLIFVLLFSLFPVGSSTHASNDFEKVDNTSREKIQEILKNRKGSKSDDGVYIDENIDIESDQLIKVIVEFNSEPLAVQEYLAKSTHSISSSFNLQSAEEKLVQEEVTFKQTLTNNNIFAKISSSFHKVFNGVVIEIKANEVPKLAFIDGVQGVYANNFIQVNPILPQAEDENKIQMVNSPSFIGSKEFWDLGYEGEGIKIGVLDTGIDYNHPDLKEAYKGGYDFVDNDNDPFEGSEKISSYHGTHVAGIIGARGNPDTGGVRGVAPKSDLYAYRVLGPQGGYDEWVIAGIEKAVEDGMDIINLSLGAMVNDSDTPTARAVNNAMIAGTLPVVANGNSGMKPGQVSSPATAALALSVGASFSPKYFYSFKGSFSGIKDKEYTLNWPSSIEPAKEEIDKLFEGNEIVYVGLGMPEDYEGLDVKGKIVLAKANPAIYDFAFNHWAEEAGAQAIIIFNVDGKNGAAQRWFPVNFLRLPAFDMRGDDGRELAEFLSQTETLSIEMDAVQEEKTESSEESLGADSKADVPDEELVVEGPQEKTDTVIENTENQLQNQGHTFKLTEQHKENWQWVDMMADFSSSGPVNDTGDIKPDVVAPGVEIVSTIPLYFNDPYVPGFPLNYRGAYFPLSGTSMAAPHVAGLAALMMEAKPDYTLSDIKVALMNTGLKLEKSAYNQPAKVYDIGGGRVQGLEAMNTPVLAKVHQDVYYTKDPLGSTNKEKVQSFTGSINFGRLEGSESVEKMITLENKSGSEVAYELSYDMNFLPSTSNGGPGGIFSFDIGQEEELPEGVQLSLSTNNAVINANGTLGVSASIEIPTDAPFGVYDGYIYLTPKNTELPHLKVPFIAYKKADILRDLKYFEMSSRVINFNKEEYNTTLKYALNADMKEATVEIISMLPLYGETIGNFNINPEDLVKGEHELVWNGEYTDFNNQPQKVESGWYFLDVYFTDNDGRTYTEYTQIVVSNEKSDISVHQPVVNDEIYVTDNWISGSVESIAAAITRDVWFTHDPDLNKGYVKVKYEINQGNVLSPGNAGMTTVGVDYEKNQINFVIKDALPPGKSTLKLTAYDGAGNENTVTYNVFYDKDISVSNPLEILLGQDLIIDLTANNAKNLIGGEFTLQYRSDIFEFDHANPGFGFANPDEEALVSTSISEPWHDLNGHEYRTLKVGANLLNKDGGTIEGKTGNIPLVNVVFKTKPDGRHLGTHEIKLLGGQYIQDQTFTKVELEGYNFYPNIYLESINARGILELEAYMTDAGSMRKDVEYHLARVEIYDAETGRIQNFTDGYRGFELVKYIEPNGTGKIHIQGLHPDKLYDIFVYFGGHFKGFINNYSLLKENEDGSLTADLYIDDYGNTVSTKKLDFGLLLAGDVDADNKIDIYDVTVISRYFGSVADDQGFFETTQAKQADINRDGRIDILDLSFATHNYGASDVIQND